MADPFQPRFVDLVRNLTSTQGTGNIVLGAAVTGFTSFTPTILVGESFYYSVIGIDKPAEREVGRGTMLANGTISRDPINNTLTNFTTGSKSIALIAAAEWFTSVAGSIGQDAGLSVERSGFVNFVSNSAAVLSVVNNFNTLTIAGSDGDWWAHSASPLTGDFVVEIENPTMTGDHWPPFWFAATAAEDFAQPPAETDFQYSNNDADRAGTLFIASRAAVIGYGKDSTLYGLKPKLFLKRVGSELQYWAGKELETAIAVGSDAFHADPVYFNTNSSYSWPEAPPNTYIIRIYDALAAGTLSTQVQQLGEALGYNLSKRPHRYYPEFRGRFYLNSIYQEKGDDTWVRIQNNPTGVVGSYNPYHVRFHHNGNEWKMGVRNPSTNCIQIGIAAGTWQGMEVVGNQFAHQVGTADVFRSTATGLTVTGTGSFSGDITVPDEAYGAGWNGSLEVPTKNALYGKIETISGSIPDPYVPADGTMNVTGGIAATGLLTGSDASFVNAGPSDNALDIYTADSSGPRVSAFNKALSAFRPLFLRGEGVTLSYGSTAIAVISGTGLAVTGTVSATDQISVAPSGNQGLYSGTGATVSGWWSTATSAEQGIAFFNGPHEIAFQCLNDYRVRITASSLEPYIDNSYTLGAASKRWLTIYGVNGVFSGSVTSSGATSGVGYSAGAGGTVTQATNKSTGVTLNKICGRVTMAAASLAASTSVSFTLTNSTIAATDVVLFNIASGGATNAYLIAVDAVAAGSCRVHLRNISAGALAEALVLNFAVIKSVTA